MSSAGLSRPGGAPIMTETEMRSGSRPRARASCSIVRRAPASLSAGSAIGIHPSPQLATRFMALGPIPPRMTGGCGRCTGFGRQTAGGKRTHLPSHARARSVTGSALPVTNMRTPVSKRRYLLRVGRPGGLGLFEMLDRLVLEPVRERFVARVELLAGLAEIFPLGLRLLVLGEELLLDLGGSLGPHGRGQRERDGDGGGPEHVSQQVSPLGWPFSRS